MVLNFNKTQSVYELCDSYTQFNLKQQIFVCDLQEKIIKKTIIFYKPL